MDSDIKQMGIIACTACCACLVFIVVILGWDAVDVTQ